MNSPLTGTELRSRFLSFFEKNGHSIVKSGPLVPQGDATLLFTNAGMVPFKDVFTGRETRPYKRAASSQKCVRAGGKHNDLENVGRTARHHTFFEMLGNFSFGDYFKVEACRFAWKFLTEELKIPKERLHVTVFGGDPSVTAPADDEAARIWHEEIGVPLDKIVRHGAKDNFWSMGDTGACGPCTEIHYDRGNVEGAFGGDDPEGDRVLEIWNLVFMQYERTADGKYKPLPAPSIDTGMGLERLAMVMGGYASNYDTDLLRPLIAVVEQALGKKYSSSDGVDDVAMRVIADHARTTAFLIADGVLPGNEKQSYVLRRIMRRAIVFGNRVGFEKPFLHDVTAKVIEIFEGHYPELTAARGLIDKMVRAEEDMFRRTLTRGLELFEKATEGKKSGDVFDGAVAHRLLATFGFPKDLTELLARERGLTVDEKAYQTAKDLHAEASTTDDAFSSNTTDDAFKALRNKHGATHFLGYDVQKGDGNVLAILRDGAEVQSLAPNERGEVIVDVTPFYGESGGQLGDTGTLKAEGVLGRVEDTRKVAELHVHTVTLAHDSKPLTVGAKAHLVVDDERLERIRRNHSATHLLHHALRTVLGDHVTQKGSLVAPERLRFDFSHFEPMTPAQVEQVEDLVNALVLENVAADVEQLGFEDARKKGAMALFGEKYGDRVRVVSFGPSIELCGGIHVRRTGDIGLFKIIGEGPLAAGVRRLEAVTGKGALEWARTQASIVTALSRSLRVADVEVPSRIERLQADLKVAEKELERARQKAQTASALGAVSDARDVEGVKVLAMSLGEAEGKGMRDYADKLRAQLKSGVVVLGAPAGPGKCTLLVALTPDLVGKLHAGKIVGELAAVVGGKGGGKPDLAQAGGAQPEKLGEALGKVDDVLRAALHA